MASRTIARRFLATGARATRQQAPRLSRSNSQAAGHGAHGSTSQRDTIWMIGSAAVFLPTLAYLLSPAARSAAHKAHEGTAHSPPDVPAQAAPSGAADAEAKADAEVVTTDDEGTKVPVEEVKESTARAFATDSPQDASAAEVADAKFDGKPGQSSESETPQEQSENPQPEAKSGTVNPPGHSEPTEQGKAREESKSGKDPKQAEDHGEAETEAK